MSSERLLPHAALSAHAHNRIGLRRTDDAWLEARMADPATRVLVVAGNRLRPVDGAVEWVAPDQAPEGTLVLLGDRDDVVHVAVIVAPDDAPGDAEEWVPLRDVLTLLAEGTPDQAPLVMHAIGLAEWHHATRFCPRCGGTLVSRAAGHELRCTQCDRAQFPRTDPAVIMAITHGEGDDEAILLGRNRAWPPGRWSTLAGFCEPGETLEDAVRREVDEEVGVRVGEVSLLRQPAVAAAREPDARASPVGRVSTEIDVDGAEIEEARWWTRAEFEAAGRSGELVVPRGISISSSLIETLVRPSARRARAGTERAAQAQSQLSQMPVAGSAMKQRGAQLVDAGRSRPRAGAGVRRAGGGRPRRARRRRPGARARAGARAASRRGCRSRAASAPCSRRPSRPGCRPAERVRPVARPCAMPAIAAASYSLPWCSRTWVETPPRTSM